MVVEGKGEAAFAAGGLHDVHAAAARRKKRHHVHGGNIHAFRQTAGIGHDGSRRRPEVAQFAFAAHGRHGAIDVEGLKRSARILRAGCAGVPARSFGTRGGDAT